MPITKEYFRKLPFSFKSAVIIVSVVTIMVTLQSYTMIGRVKSKPDFWISEHALFPLLNHVIWLVMAPLIYMLLLKLQVYTSSGKRYGALFMMSVGFTIGHEVVGLLFYNLIIALRDIDMVLEGTYSFYIAPGVIGLYNSYFEFWIIYFVLLSFHNQKNARNYQLRNSQLQSDLLRAQMSALKNQLHPHFLFNSFNTISALMEENTQQAQRMISKLGALLRKILKEGDAQVISIKKELELAQLYLEVEQIRFKNKLEVRYSLDTNIENLVVPTLLLQPSIENAIKHGFYQKKDNCEIAIMTYKEADMVCIEIEDNGAGIKNQSAFSFGIGLSNTLARLQRCYEDQFQFTAQPYESEGGFKVTFKIKEKAMHI